VARPSDVSRRHRSNQLPDFVGDLRTSWSLPLGQAPPVPLESPPLPTQNSSGLYEDERRSPLFLDLHQGYPEQSIAMPEFRPRLFPFEDRQLLSQSGILQRDVFVAGEDENDELQRAENRYEHDAVLWPQRYGKSIAQRLFRVLAKDRELPLILKWRLPQKAIPVFLGGGRSVMLQERNTRMECTSSLYRLRLRQRRSTNAAPLT
jgi:hypothetical protein